MILSVCHRLPKYSYTYEDSFSSIALIQIGSTYLKLIQVDWGYNYRSETYRSKYSAIGQIFWQPRVPISL